MKTYATIQEIGRMYYGYYNVKSVKGHKGSQDSKSHARKLKSKRSKIQTVNLEVGRWNVVVVLQTKGFEAF